MAPANTVTEVGTPLGAVLFRLTANPPVGAAVAIVTVPEVAVPPVTDVGLIAREETVGALMVSLADFESVSVDAKIVTVVVVAIGFAANVKLVVVLLPGITTVAGTLVRWNLRCSLRRHVPTLYQPTKGFLLPSRLRQPKWETT